MTATPRTADTTLGIRQSLAHGPLGMALLDIELAHRGLTSWRDLHRRLATVHPLIDGDEASLFLGAPAMLYVLHLAAGDSGRYAGALLTLDGIVETITHRRLAAAHARIDQGHFTTFAEYDLFRGLTGLGVLLLRRQPRGVETRRVLEYLVRLTEPVTGPGGEQRPGWWVGHSPGSDPAATPGGHANAGLAHGIAGPLALLALAKERGVTVDGHDPAMTRICGWLDGIRQSDPRGTRWPRWISKAGPAPAGPETPSWCYGTPGLARAQQLAAIALGDQERKWMAEQALLGCVANHQQLDLLADRGLCHGVGGLLCTVQRVADDAEDPAAFRSWLLSASQRFFTADAPKDPGFLVGAAGAELALLGVEPGAESLTNWDACLLLS